MQSFNCSSTNSSGARSAPDDFARRPDQTAGGRTHKAYCTSVQMFPAVNGVYAKFFPKNPPARIFVNVPAHPGPFDIEIDCVASV